MSSDSKIVQAVNRNRRESYSRTDENVQFELPDESQMPHSPTVKDMRFKRTLTQFSLENTVAVVTGGARGLGLVMAQALITSGADLAIVDLNSTSSFKISIRIVEYSSCFNCRGRSPVPGRQLGQTIPPGESHFAAVCHQTASSKRRRKTKQVK